MSPLLQETEDKMQKAVDHLTKKYRNIRTNRVYPNMLDDVKIDLHGTAMPLKALASISVQERNLLITPYDPNTNSAIIKSVSVSSFTSHPIQEKNHIRVPVPPLSEEMRKEIAKQAKSEKELTIITIREIRKQSNENIKKQKNLTEDDRNSLKKEVQNLTNKYCTRLEEMHTKKEEEILRK